MLGTSPVAILKVSPKSNVLLFVSADNVIVELTSFALAIEPANIVFVTEPVSPVVTTVPVTFGNVIVLSAVGSATVSVVSKSSAAPSNTSVKLPATAPETVKALIVGAVNVLFVIVAVFVKETKICCKALLNSAKVPVTVFN